MRSNQFFKGSILSLILAITLSACHSIKKPTCNEMELRFIAPKGFFVKELTQDAYETTHLYWTFNYSKSGNSVKLCDNSVAGRELREFNVLCAFQNGIRVFYKEFYDEYDPYTLKKGLSIQLNHFNRHSPIRFYWYHVIIFSQGQGVVLKNELINERDPFQVTHESGTVEIISERVMVGNLIKSNQWIETPLSWMDTWVDKIKKQKINRPF